ncbi:MAG: HD domain-containing phosphohydrolase [Planctomycetota bacterium]
MPDVEQELKRMRILIVEDEEDALSLMARKFEFEGFTRVEGVATGEEALKRLGGARSSGQAFSLVLLDLMLPGTSGEEVLHKIKKNYHIPVVVVTARSERESQLQLLEMGADDYIVKPFDSDILFLKVEKILTRFYLEEELRRMNRRNQRLFLNVLQVMAKVLEAKDPYTKFHSENVAKYARKIAKSMGYSPDEVELIQVAGILHDFGKIGVKEGVLNKVGHLTDKEFDAVKRHPVIAATILEPIEELNSIIADIRHHHEYYNGHGYPSGLKAEEIPLGARILQVADAFDAMTSQRSYHDPMTREEALRELNRCSGSQFDPRIVEVFIRILTDESGGPAARRP